MDDLTVIVAVHENGTFYVRPGVTVGQLLAVAEALKGLALNVQVNTAPTKGDASNERG